MPVLVEAVKATHDRRTALSQELAEVDSQQRSDADYDCSKRICRRTLRHRGRCY